MLWISISNRNRKLTYSSEFFCASLAALGRRSFAYGRQPHLLQSELHPSTLHQVDATAMNGCDVFEGRRIHHVINVKSSSLDLYRDRDFIRFAAAMTAYIRVRGVRLHFACRRFRLWPSWRKYLIWWDYDRKALSSGFMRRSADGSGVESVEVTFNNRQHETGDNSEEGPES